MDFSIFDHRKYPTVSVREGYGEWVRTYDRSVQDEMDLRLLDRVQRVPWSTIERAVDLACGTGRTGAWLARQGIPHIVGVDMTPEMLEVARARGHFADLVLGDIAATGLEPGRYDLATMVLADEHLPVLSPVYVEAARLTRAGGYFVVVGYHPHFLMQGIITHFHRENGDPIAIESYVHLLSDHVGAAMAAGWRLLEMDEGIVDEAWLAKKPQWARFRNHPVSFSMVWRRPEP